MAVERPNQLSLSGVFDGVTVDEVDQLLNPESHSKLKLDDGSFLGFASFGADSLVDGKVIFLFPGLGMNRSIGCLFHSAARREGFRIISLDRPGIGFSDDHDELCRTKEACMKVRKLAKTLNLTKIRVIGHSVGAIYAMSAAIYLADILVPPVVLIAPWVSVKLENSRRTIKFAARYVPESLIILGSKVNFALTSPILSLAPSILTSSMSIREKASVNSTVGKYALGKILQSLGTGNRTGVERDTLLCLEKRYALGFAQEHLQFDISIYHGSKDTTVPLNAVKEFCRTLNKAPKLFILENGTHNLCLDHEVVQLVVRECNNNYESNG